MEVGYQNLNITGSNIPLTNLTTTIPGPLNANASLVTRWPAPNFNATGTGGGLVFGAPCTKGHGKGNCWSSGSVWVNLDTIYLCGKAEHECTRGWPRSVPVGISNSECYTWIRAGFSHRVTWSCESKTHGFSSTCGSTGTWKYLQVLRILKRNKVVNCKHKYMWNKILQRYSVTPWQNQIWLDRPCAS